MSSDPDRVDDAAAAPSVPSAWLLERAISAWQQLRASMLSDEELIMDENAIAFALKQADAADPRDLLAAVIDACVWAERHAVEAKLLKNEYADRQHRYEQRLEMMRVLIEQIMRAIPVEKFPAKLARAAIVDAPQSLLVIDEGLIADEWFKVERTLRRGDLRDHLKETGEIMAGATLSNGGTALRLTKVK
jgi:hypothetical protein